MALKDIVKAVSKEVGEGMISLLEDAPPAIPAWPTGSLTLDYAIGIGGLPKGRIVELVGNESSGKTTLALSAIAQVQKAGGVAAFIDAEQALDLNYAQALGVNVNELLICQPDYGEQALNVVEALVKTGQVDLVVVDSVSALVPKAEMEGEIGQANIGLQARMMSQAMRMLTPLIRASKCLVIFTNQYRINVGTMYGDPRVTSGGNALKFYASVRMSLTGKKIERKGMAVGSHVTVKVMKNKVGPPFRTGEYDIMYGQGIDRMSELVGLAIHFGVIAQKGAWFVVEGQTVQGKEAVRDVLDTDPELAVAVEAKVQECLRAGGTPVGPTSDEQV